MPIEYISETLSLDDDDALMYSFVIRKDGSLLSAVQALTEVIFLTGPEQLYDEVEGQKKY